MTSSLHLDSAKERHVVLVAPEIPWNTGNIGRTCLGTDAHLHLIEPLGFSLEDHDVKRAGLDYWKNVKLSVWKDFDAFLDHMNPKKHEIAVFTKNGSLPYWALPSSQRRLFLVFGSETRGLPDKILRLYSKALFFIPMSKNIRSLNLSTAAGIALYESLRSSGN